MAQLTQIVGALFVLTGFAALQTGWLTETSVTYLLCNLIGSTVLALLAFGDDQWGFLLLEGCVGRDLGLESCRPLQATARVQSRDPLAAGGLNPRPSIDR